MPFFHKIDPCPENFGTVSYTHLVYRELADELNRYGMYAEQSGGLALNYGFEERGMNRTMLDIFRSRNVAIRFASDAHRPEDVGANIAEMQAALLV